MRIMCSSQSSIYHDSPWISDSSTCCPAPETSWLKPARDTGRRLRLCFQLPLLQQLLSRTYILRALDGTASFLRNLRIRLIIGRDLLFCSFVRVHLYIGIATPVRRADLLSNGRLAVLGFFANELNSPLRNSFAQYSWSRVRSSEFRCTATTQ